MNRRNHPFPIGLALGGPARLIRVSAEGATQPARTRLSLNENPFGPSPLALAVVRDELSELCRYGRELGDILTQRIAAREGLSMDEVMIGDILEPLGFRLAQDGPSGGEFIYSEPGYTALVDAVLPSGGVVIGVPLNHELENDLPAIASKVNERTRAIYLVNPHNPSGTVSDTVNFIAFVREMSKRTLVIVDEAYLEFDSDFEKRTAMGLVRDGENVVVFRTFDKIFGLAGLGVGYGIAAKALATSLKNAGVGSADAVDRLSLAAALASLQDSSYVATTRAKVAAERGKWHELLSSMRLRHSESRGNFVFFETGHPHHEIAAAMRAKGIEVGRAFPPLDDWVRISIGLPHENAMARAVIAELLR
ncbi:MULTISPECIES: pyridoxal phosphate-dependent aminotransferase [Bradyrhizobium]|uniref:pyridoxal phosphate-dependent aminotransferase n=1 Tax=Bradyrhizobium elkanii TaxID=29448 RepID=UPI001FD9243C|nr:histidinol-phosphate transaminase [Bradyrhizobium elkanii]